MLLEKLSFFLVTLWPLTRLVLTAIDLHCTIYSIGALHEQVQLQIWNAEKLA